MKKDGRTIDHKTLEFIRKMAVERVQLGERPAEVIESYGMNRTVIYKWLKAVAKPGAGLEALNSKNGAGRPKKLNEAQESQVFRWINGKSPKHHGFNSGLWSRQIVKDLVEERLGVTLCLPSIGSLLTRRGLIPQNPLDSAYQRTPETIEEWERITYPAIVKSARRENGEIFFWDEFRFDKISFPSRRGDHPGQHPLPGTHAASAMNFQGAFWFATFQGSLTGEVFLDLLKKMMYRRSRPLHLVLDSHPAHRRAIIKRYLEKNRKGLTLHFLPESAHRSRTSELWGSRSMPIEQDSSSIQSRER